MSILSLVEINHEYHVVEMNSIPTEVSEWLLTMFGSPNKRTWFIRNPNIYFYNENDHMMFLVRWS